MTMISKDEMASRVKAELLLRLNGRSFPEEEIDQAITQVLTHASEPAVAALFESQQLLCDRCGECCKRCQRLILRPAELIAISKHVGVKPHKLMKRYDISASPDGDSDGTGYSGRLFEARRTPCPFLIGGNVCSVYPVRPPMCSEFPARSMMIQIQGGQGLELPGYCHVVQKWLAGLAAGMLTDSRTR